jgi:hypothetical protein
MLNQSTAAPALISMAEVNVRSIDATLLDEWTIHLVAEIRQIAFAERARRARINHDPDSCKLYDACPICEQIAGDIRESWGLVR